MSFAIDWDILSCSFVMFAGDNNTSTKFASGLNTHSTHGYDLISPFSFLDTITESSFST